ncbi:MAG: hypothetical protein Kow0081_5020 [Candidatus Dojkabacteria bacterium]
MGKLIDFLLLPLRKIESVLYKIRDAFWDYPELFSKDSYIRKGFDDFYSRNIPLSHFMLAFLTFLVIFNFVFIFNVSAVLDRNTKKLIEGVVMGYDTRGEVQSLSKVNPLLPSNIQLEKDLASLIYEPLIRYKYKEAEGGAVGGVEYVLAEDVITIKPGSDYIFKLRKGVMWHDSSPDPLSDRYRIFSADDVIKTFNILSTANDNVQGLNSNAYTRTLKQLQWEKIDQFTIRVCTKPVESEAQNCDERQNNPILSNFLELISFNIVPAHLSDDINPQSINTGNPKLFKGPVGTGIFKITNISKSSISLELFKNHYSLKEDFIIDKLKNLVIENYDPLNDLTRQSFSLQHFNKTYTLRYLRNSDETLTFKHNNSEIILPYIITNKDNQFYVEKITFEYYATLDSAVTALKNGEIHTLASLSTKYQNEIKDYKQINSIESPVLYNQFWGLYFNLRTTPDGRTIANPALQDQNVRRAISAAINRKDIIENALSGIGEEAFGPIPSISYYFNKNAGWYTYGAANPNELLEEAGWVLQPGSTVRRNSEGQELTLSLYFVENEDRRKIASSLKEMLADYGINLIIDKVDQPLYQGDTSPQGWTLEELNERVLAPRFFDILLYGMNTFIDPDRYELYHSSQSSHPGLNLSGYRSQEETVDKNENRQEGESSVIRVPKVDRFLELGRSFDPEGNQDNRRDLYNTVQEIIAREVPVVYLFHPQYVYYANKNVEQIILEDSYSLESRFIDIGQWRLN